MKPLAASPVRIARPSHDPRAAERFGISSSSAIPRTRPQPAPTEEDLLVLYLGGEVDEDLVRRLLDAGGTRVSARNPYWARGGITIADPDGYRLVLSTLSWP
jgi:hypothetical protein